MVMWEPTRPADLGFGHHVQKTRSHCIQNGKSSQHVQQIMLEEDSHPVSFLDHCVTWILLFDLQCNISSWRYHPQLSVCNNGRHSSLPLCLLPCGQSRKAKNLGCGNLRPWGLLHCSCTHPKDLHKYCAHILPSRFVVNSFELIIHLI